MSLWKVSVSITKLSKRPANYRARSLCALSQRHCMSWVTWILLAEVILSEVRGHHLSLLTFNKLNTAVQTALDFRSDSTELGAQKSWFTRIYWCLTSGANPVHISFFFSISPPSTDRISCHSLPSHLMQLLLFAARCCFGMHSSTCSVIVSPWRWHFPGEGGAVKATRLP